MKCNRCGKENPAEIHTCTPKALVLADQLEDAESARLHLLPYTAAELRRLHDENEALKAAQYECGFGAGCCYQAAKSEADEVLLRQALEALEEYQQKGAPFLSCDRVANAIRQHLEGKV